MNANRSTTPTEWVDPDDAPELTDEFFEEADLYHGDKLIRRGRPNGSNKTSTTIRFDNSILEAFKAAGPRWQTRLNAAVQDWLKTHSPKDLEV
ncbi:BrnA antitoxin family protein [Burkholderia alba]|uniref:BrnA antitoxin family protein n=1 Tax=Burkholderia alba TaxID=2683677 RepID=UPI002B06041C|nr:BrnA antitoxin family protein [Burkholderia alba]